MEWPCPEAVTLWEKREGGFGFWALLVCCERSSLYVHWIWREGGSALLSPGTMAPAGYVCW